MVAKQTRVFLFFMFFLSGFCGLLYQIVWLRLAFASFGIITPVLSVLISVFMTGLALGSWIGGKWAENGLKKANHAMLAYAAVELIIGISAFLVPWIFHQGENFLLPFGEVDSFKYLLLSGSIIALAILPWCVCMGMTFPLMMAYVRKQDQTQQNSFSFLYLANVIGAMFGACLTALVLVEFFGFLGTLKVAAFSNFTIAVIGFFLSRALSNNPASDAVVTNPSTLKTSNPLTSSSSLATTVLFTTGFVSMAMEVVWTRAFTPVIQTTIYAFAILLATYLCATWVGSYIYRKHLSTNRVLPIDRLLTWLAVAAFLPLVINDPRIGARALSVLGSIFPFCALLGYLTPQLIDQVSQGNPEKAGRAYAINILGCIFGPLAAGYLLLPWLGVKWALVILAVPFVIFAFTRAQKNGLRFAAAALLLVSMFVSKTYEDGLFYKHSEIRRDSTATVIAHGEGLNKGLLVNGYGITTLTPITKIMAHFPLSVLPNPPHSAVVICFGMGTTFRSLMSWGIQVKAVELVPSVKESFGFFFSDAEKILSNPKGEIIVDDGRRFLKRTTEKFDLITLDPPPPVEAAGSGLLYSREFYDTIQARLTPDGILHQWFPGGERLILEASVRSIINAFPYVRAFHSVEGWGYHFLASMKPIEIPSVAVMESRTPVDARADLIEWYPGRSVQDVYKDVTGREFKIADLLNKDPSIFISDSKPINEYFWVRRGFQLAPRGESLAQ